MNEAVYSPALRYFMRHKGLLGQSALQVIFCTDMPWQKAPPLSGAGLVQVRERFWTPRPQGTLQGDHSVHSDHPPFTTEREIGVRERETDRQRERVRDGWRERWMEREMDSERKKDG